MAGTDLAHQGPKAWQAALEALLDPAERKRRGDEARNAVADHDIRKRWTDWEVVYGELLDSTAT